MTIKGEIGMIESRGDAVKVSLINVRPQWQANWRPYDEGMSFTVPMSAAKTYIVGRIVKLTVCPKKA